MGNWDSIYKNYQQGGDAWATLSEGIDDRFIQLIEKSNFVHKKALDIGCGTGKYLSYLEKHGFLVDGIDSSPTAVTMTQEVATKPSNIQLANMYEFTYPKNKYDLVLSVSTLHHGKKSQIKNVVTQIHDSLTSEGIIFITIPNFDASNSWETFKEHTEIEPRTYSPNVGPEKGIPHSFFTENEIKQLFFQFNELELDLDEIGRWFIIGKK